MTPTATLVPADEAQFRTDLMTVIPSLRAYARSLCYNPDLADDLTQEALIKGWAARASFMPAATFAAGCSASCETIISRSSGFRGGLSRSIPKSPNG